MTDENQSCESSPTHSHSLAGKAGWGAAASACSLFGRLIAQVMIARMLGPDGVGRIAYIICLIEIVNAFSSFGLPTSLTRYLAELHGRKSTEQATHFAQWIFIRYLVLAILGSVVVALVFFRSSQYSGGEVLLPVLVVLFLARGLQTINQADLAGRQRFDLLTRINVAATVTLVVGVAAGAHFFGITGALYGYAAGAVLPAVYSFSMLRGFSLHRKIDPELRKRVWKFTFNTWLAMVVSAVVWSQVEILFIEHYWNDREVAMFTVGLTFALMVRRAAQMFSGVFMAHFSQLVGNGSHDLIQRHYETATRLMALVVIPLGLGGAAIMPALLPLAYGVEFTAAVPNAMVLMAGSSLAFSGIGSALVYARERTGFIALSGLAGTVLSITAGFLIVSHFGAWGAVWSRVVVQSTMTCLGTWYIVRRLHFAYPLRAVGRTLIAGSLCGISAWWTVCGISSPSIALCVAVPLGAIVYVVGVRVFHVLGSDEVRQLKRIVNRLPLRIHRPCESILNAMEGSP